MERSALPVQPDDTASPMPMPPTPRKRLRKWLLRATIAVCVFVALTPVTLWCWGAWETRRLESRLSRLRAQGDPVAPADLNSKPVADYANAVIELRDAASSLDPSASAWKAMERIERFRMPFYDEEIAAIRAAVEENAYALLLIERAAQKPLVDWKLSFTSPMLLPDMPDLTAQRTLANLLRGAALAAHLDGNDRRALRHVREMLFIAEAVGRHPTLVGHLVSVGIDSLAVDTIGQIAADVRIGGDDPRAVSAQDVKGLIDALTDETAFRDSMIDAYRHERVIGVDALTAIADGKVGGGPGQTPSRSSSVRLRGFLLRNACGISDYFDGLVKVAGECDDWPTFRDRLAATPADVNESPRLYFAAQIFTGSYDRAGYAHYAHLTERRLAATALAIAVFRAEHGGRFPGALGELTPAYLPAIPRDALGAGGPPIRYLADAERPRLYSVGENGVDDGGRMPDETASTGRRGQSDSDLVLDLRHQPKPPPSRDEEHEESVPPVTTP